MSKFERPKNLSFPHVYYTFKVKDKGSDHVVEYRVQDLTEEYFETALDLIVAHFVPEETFCLCKRISESLKSINAICEFYRGVFKKRLSIACFKNEGDDKELVAVNVFVVKESKDEDHYDVNNFTIFLKAFHHIFLCRLKTKTSLMFSEPLILLQVLLTFSNILKSISIFTQSACVSTLITEDVELQQRCFKLTLLF
jgi:hypothetical protein